MPPREIFLQACNEVAAQLNGFCVLQKGQTLKKHSPDKSIECQIHFQANRRNYACDITTQVHFSLHSQALQKWQAAQGSPHVSGCLLTGELSAFTLRQAHRGFGWQLAGASLPHSVRQIVSELQQYALPIFELFCQPEAALNFLQQHGTRFNGSLKNDNLHLLDYILCFGSPAQAARFWQQYAADNPKSAKRLIALYQILENPIPPNPQDDSFAGADELKFAFAQGVRIPAWFALKAA